jgi:hypothetical protein
MLAIDAILIQVEIESNLPPGILEDVLKAKNEAGDLWSTDKLRTTLKTILKRKKGVKAIRDQQMELELPQPKLSKPTKNSGPSLPLTQPNPSHSNLFTQPSFESDFSSSLTFATQQDGKPTPKLPCRFCENLGHFSPYYPIFTTFEARLAKLNELNCCFHCLKEDYFTNKCPKPAQCSSCKGKYSRALCKRAIGGKNKSTPNNSRSTHAAQATTTQPIPPFAIPA